MGNLFAANARSKKANYIIIYEIENTCLAPARFCEANANNKRVDYIIIYEIEKHTLVWATYLHPMLEPRRPII